METEVKEYDFPAYATQGGGVVREVCGHYVFIEAPDPIMGLGVGDVMPVEWDIQPINEAARQERFDNDPGISDDDLDAFIAAQPKYKESGWEDCWRLVRRGDLVRMAVPFDERPEDAGPYGDREDFISKVRRIIPRGDNTPLFSFFHKGEFFDVDARLTRFILHAKGPKLWQAVCIGDTVEATFDYMRTSNPDRYIRQHRVVDIRHRYGTDSSPLIVTNDYNPDVDITNDSFSASYITRIISKSPKGVIYRQHPNSYLREPRDYNEKVVRTMYIRTCGGNIDNRKARAMRAEWRRQREAQTFGNRDKDFMGTGITHKKLGVRRKNMMFGPIEEILYQILATHPTITVPSSLSRRKMIKAYIANPVGSIRRPDEFNESFYRHTRNWFCVKTSTVRRWLEQNINRFLERRAVLDAETDKQEAEDYEQFCNDMDDAFDNLEVSRIGLPARRHPSPDEVIQGDVDADDEGRDDPQSPCKQHLVDEDDYFTDLHGHEPGADASLSLEDSFHADPALPAFDPKALEAALAWAAANPPTETSLDELEARMAVAAPLLPKEYAADYVIYEPRLKSYDANGQLTAMPGFGDHRVCDDANYQVKWHVYAEVVCDGQPGKAVLEFVLREKPPIDYDQMTLVAILKAGLIVSSRYDSRLHPAFAIAPEFKWTLIESK